MASALTAKVCPGTKDARMARLSNHPIRNRDDLTRFESALSLAQRLPEPSVLDVFIGAA